MIDPWTAGYRCAVDLASSELAREDLLRRVAGADPRWLAGFLLGHAQFLRNARCTCGGCPIHDDLELAPNPRAN